MSWPATRANGVSLCGVRRVSLTEIRLFSQLHIFLQDGELLDDNHDRDFYSAAWRLARSDSFELAG